MVILPALLNCLGRKLLYLRGFSLVSFVDVDGVDMVVGEDVVALDDAILFV